ncbi:MAG: fibro-slime domain-containing protein [Fibromonadales bacterium]|nr:fibro-slime domain-containing protein [Fibromonadales bacterium]
MIQFYKLALILFAVALFAGNASAQCVGKKVYIKLPAGWPTNEIWVKSDQVTSLPLTQEGAWYTFTFSDNHNFGSGKNVRFHRSNSEGSDILKITPSGWDRPNIQDNWSCNTLPAVSYIYESLTTPGITVRSTDPPNAKFFYFLPPSDPKWTVGEPYLVWFDGVSINKERLTFDTRCGWYKKMWADGNAPSGPAWIFLNADGDDRIGLYGMDEEPQEWVGGVPTPFNLMEQFQQVIGGSSDLFFIPANGSPMWGTTDQGREGVCSYNFAAIIYDTDASKNSSFFLASASSASIGIVKGIPQHTLIPDAQGVPKMAWGNPSGAADGWTQQNFLDAFRSIPGKNVKRCYDMPFKRNSDGLWEFNSNKLCANGVMDLDGTCAGNGGYMGGFFPPELQYADDEYYSQCAACNTKYTVESWVPLNSTISQYCYDRGRRGTGTTIAGCGAEFGAGDFIDGSNPAIWNWENRMSVSGQKNAFFCFETAPAEFVYKPGQEFFFNGGDDIWVYINNKLVVDLGGTHLAAPGYVNLDAQAVSLGLVPGQKYPINVFYCNRRLTMANFRMAIDMYFEQKNLFSVAGNTQLGGANVCIESTSFSGTCRDVMGGGTPTPGGSECGQQLGNILDYYLLSRSGQRFDLRPNAPHGQCLKVENDLLCYGGIILQDYFRNPEGAVSNVVTIGAYTDLVGSYKIYAEIKENLKSEYPNAEPLFIASIVSGEEDGLYSRGAANGTEICLKEAGVNTCGAELAPSLSYTVITSGQSIPMNSGNPNCLWINDTFGICYGGIVLNNGIIGINENGITESILQNGFDIRVSVPGYPALIVFTNRTTPIISKTKMQISFQDPVYYSLKGVSLGKEMPKKAGIYIERRKGVSKMIVVK